MMLTVDSYCDVPGSLASTDIKYSHAGDHRSTLVLSGKLENVEQ